jgi:hypothetical protein
MVEFTNKVFKSLSYKTARQVLAVIEHKFKRKVGELPNN